MTDLMNSDSRCRSLYQRSSRHRGAAQSTIATQGPMATALGDTAPQTTSAVAKLVSRKAVDAQRICASEKSKQQVRHERVKHVLSVRIWDNLDVTQEEAHG